MTPYDVVKLLLTFLGAAATPVAALPDDLLPVWGKVAAVAVGSACVATLAQLDKLGHRHPSVARNAPDPSPLAVNDVPISAAPVVNRAHDDPDAIYAAGFADGRRSLTPPAPVASGSVPVPHAPAHAEPAAPPRPRAGQYPEMID